MRPVKRKCTIAATHVLRIDTTSESDHSRRFWLVAVISAASRLADMI